MLEEIHRCTGFGPYGLFLLLMQAACRSVPPAAPPAADAPQIRFVLMFDDGPSIREPYNPTLAILDQLAANPVQPEIKALFFVQTGLTRITANVPASATASSTAIT